MKLDWLRLLLSLLAAEVTVTFVVMMVVAFDRIHAPQALFAFVGIPVGLGVVFGLLPLLRRVYSWMDATLGRRVI